MSFPVLDVADHRLTFTWSTCHHISHLRKKNKTRSRFLSPFQNFENKNIFMLCVCWQLKHQQSRNSKQRKSRISSLKFGLAKELWKPKCTVKIRREILLQKAGKQREIPKWQGHRWNSRCFLHEGSEMLHWSVLIWQLTSLFMHMNHHPGESSYNCMC